MSDVKVKPFRPSAENAPFATQERLNLPHSLVTITNASEHVMHTVIDRHMMGHELKPGHKKKDVEMLNSDIVRFQSMPTHDIKIDTGAGVQRKERVARAS